MVGRKYISKSGYSPKGPRSTTLFQYSPNAILFSFLQAISAVAADAAVEIDDDSVMSHYLNTTSVDSLNSGIHGSKSVGLIHAPSGAPSGAGYTFTVKPRSVYVPCSGL